jgi:quinol monooxygenase YgiN
MSLLGMNMGGKMISRDYFARQAVTLMKLARLTKDPQFAASLADKAAGLKALSDEAPLAPDVSPIPPDVTRPDLKANTMAQDVGCLRYEWYRSSESRTYILIERWQNQDVAQTHLKAKYLSDLMPQYRAYVPEMFTINPPRKLDM